ncbi:hypothetical protein [Amycolatopsis tucumanensis]|uniref:hypothetical protein n=1 Tax=Amycolatopsis tucumanensis TaxID=401106 RepID=UPI0031E85C29
MIGIAGVFLAACTGSSTSPATDSGSPSQAGPSAAVEAKPADGARDLAPGDPVMVSAKGSTLRNVSLMDEKASR